METITYRRKKQSGQREAMIENLPVELIDYLLPEAEQTCSCCGGDLHEMSTETRQELKLIPSEVYCLRVSLERLLCIARTSGRSSKLL